MFPLAVEGLKIVVFVLKKETADLIGKFSKFTYNLLLIYNNLITAGWIKQRARELNYDIFTPCQVDKFSGDNSKEEKTRVFSQLSSGLVTLIHI